MIKVLLITIGVICVAMCMTVLFLGAIAISLNLIKSINDEVENINALRRDKKIWKK